MDVNKYLENRENIKVLCLIDNEDILNSFNLGCYSSISSLDDYRKNLFSDSELVIIIIDYNCLSEDILLKNIYGLQNVMLLVVDDGELNKNLTKYTNMLFGYGYKYFGLSNNEKAQVFIYDISDYKDEPDWLNNKNWANPELWEK